MMREICGIIMGFVGLGFQNVEEFGEEEVGDEDDDGSLNYCVCCCVFDVVGVVVCVEIVVVIDDGDEVGKEVVFVDVGEYVVQCQCFLYVVDVEFQWYVQLVDGNEYVVEDVEIVVDYGECWQYDEVGGEFGSDEFFYWVGCY